MCLKIWLIKLKGLVIGGKTKDRHSWKNIDEVWNHCFYLGTLNSLGWRYTCEGGDLRVPFGLNVMLYDKLINGLYLLQDSTVVGVALESTGSSYIGDDQSFGMYTSNVLVEKFGCDPNLVCSHSL